MTEGPEDLSRLNVSADVSPRVSDRDCVGRGDRCTAGVPVHRVSAWWIGPRTADRVTYWKVAARPPSAAHRAPGAPLRDCVRSRGRS